MPHALVRPKARRVSALAAALAVVVALTGCDAADETAASSTATSSGVVITHAHGSTTIAEKPKRIVALGWMSGDIVAALGENPVGMEKVWGADDSGFQPWFTDYATEHYGELPTLISPLDEGPNYEAIKALEPDLILGLYTGISDVEYQRLSGIAPTVPYIEGPWNPGTWEEMTRTIGAAMWESDRAEEVIADTEQQIATLAAAHPEFEGKTFVWGLTLNEGGTDLGVYLKYDPRVRITEAPRIVQPEPFSRGETAVEPFTAIDASQPNARVAVLDGPDLETLVSGLNRLGVKPDGIIAILQGIKSAGALQADLVLQ